MILGNVNDLSIMVEINAKLITAINLALKQSPLLLKEGSYPIEGDNIFMNVMSFATQPAENKKFELHRNYIDVQILLQGQERIDFSTLNQAVAPTEYDERDDYQLCEEVTNLQSVELTAGMFAIFMPNEPHKPGIIASTGTTTLKKAVIKVKLAELY